VNYQITVEPAEEPITLAEAKEHLRVDFSDEDDYITALITTARKYCESYTNRVFITQTWRQNIDYFPRVIQLKVNPIISLTSLKYYDTAENQQTITDNSNNFQKDFNSDVATSNPIQLNKKYIVSKTKSGLIIINQERAHQRILYEEFLKSVTLNKVNPQKLLHPLEIDFSKADIEIIKSNKNILNQFGLDFDLKTEKINIKAIPPFINAENLIELFNNLLFNIQNEVPENSFSESDLICKIMSKTMSIKNGNYLDLKEQQYIVNSLFACKETMISPFNQKTYVKINYSEIENMFK